MAEQRLALRITGMTCDGCADTVKRHLRREKGVLAVDVDWKAGRAEIEYDPATAEPAAILRSRVFQDQLGLHRYRAEVAD